LGRTSDGFYYQLYEDSKIKKNFLDPEIKRIELTDLEFSLHKS
jgi:hypothetical protein